MVYIKEKDSPRLPNQAVISPSINCATQLNRIVSGTQPSNKSYATTFGFEPNLLPAGKRPTHSCYSRGITFCTE